MWLYERPIAHRGLHNANFPENSIQAFQNAVDNNYNIEIDIHLLKDGNIVVFHDANLSRVCKVNARLKDLTSEDLKNEKFFLPNGGGKIPLLSELLELVNGKVGLLIELKQYSPFGIGDMESKLTEMLLDYDGNYAVQSFNPKSMRWFYINNPNVMRGQLATKLHGIASVFAYGLRSLKFFNYCLPDFISYDVRALPYKRIDRFRKNHGTKLIAWTVKTEEQLATAKECNCDNVIFEVLAEDMLQTLKA